MPSLVAWAMIGLMDYLRGRWLWVKSGVVHPLRCAVPRGVNLLGAAAFVASLGLALVSRTLGWVDDAFVLRMFWVATGWAFGVTLVGVGRHIGLPRYVREGTIGVVLSPVVLFLPVSFGQSGLVLGLGWCLLLAGGGSAAPRRAWLEAREGSRGGSC